MNKKDLWRKFMKTGKVADYLNYKNASEYTDDLPVYDEEYGMEFLEGIANDIDGQLPFDEEYSDDYEDRWDSDT